MKAVFFDLDDTLLWDEKAFIQLFKKLAGKRKRNMDLIQNRLNRLYVKKQESCTLPMKHMIILS